MAYKLFTPGNVNKTQTKMKQWRNDWKILRQNGQFNCEAGDLMAPGLALVLSKHILVINTDPKSNKLITVHLAEKLGGTASSNIPLLLCYENNHYEGLLPISKEDVKKSINIVETEKLKMTQDTVNLESSIPVKKRNSMNIVEKDKLKMIRESL